MKFKETVYINQTAKDSPKTALVLDTLEAYLEKTGDRIVFAGAGICGANVQSEKGRYIYMVAADGMDTAVMTEVIAGQKIQIDRKEW